VWQGLYDRARRSGLDASKKSSIDEREEGRCVLQVMKMEKWHTENDD